VASPTNSRQIALSRRLREVREDRFGEGGTALLARSLGVPARTLENYESGCSIPGHILLGFIMATGVSPHWLLTGEGRKYDDERGKA
jgi:hypothetical protein